MTRSFKYRLSPERERYLRMIAHFEGCLRDRYAELQERGEMHLGKLANLLGVTPENARNLLVGTPVWNLETVAAVAEALDMEIEIIARKKELTGEVE